jgi:Carboxypeptidase regulatory-like domain
MSGKFVNAVRPLLVLLMVFATAGFVLGQGIVTGSISGTLVDPQGAVIANAMVKATQVETGRVFGTASSNAGVVQLPSLPPGTYDLLAEAKGFSSYTAHNVMVFVGKDTSLGAITLQVGNTAETVTVEGAAPLIESTTDQLSQAFDSKEVASVPLGNT